MSLKDGVANSEDPDPTAPEGAVGSGSALLAEIYRSVSLSQILEFLRFSQFVDMTMSLVYLYLSIWLHYEKNGQKVPPTPPPPQFVSVQFLCWYGMLIFSQNLAYRISKQTFSPLINLGKVIFNMQAFGKMRQE